MKLKSSIICLVIGLIAVVFLSSLHEARAVPTFARQTGFSCRECHTVFPALTQLGRQFKLKGYTQTKFSEQPFLLALPLSLMFTVDYTRTDKALPGGVEGTLAQNNDVLFPDQMSVFFPGKIASKLGAFVQVTYSGPDDHFSLDNTDIRFADSVSVSDRPLTYGLTLNNNPTVADIYNGTPAWGFPYFSSSVAPTPAAAAQIDGPLAQQVGGLGAYGYFNEMIYVNFTAYRSSQNGVAQPLGAGTDATNVIDDVAPYWRVAAQRFWGNNLLELGTYGLIADIFPGGEEPLQGPTNTFKDIGIDFEYQYITEPHILSLMSTWIYEKQDWDASFPAGDASNASDDLYTFRVNLDYYYKRTIGGTVAYFNTWGDTDRALYAPEEVTGSRNGSPDSEGYIVELDYFPWENVRLSAQYVIYTKFNGSSSNYDGFGRDASDNNTLFVLLWLVI